MADPTQPAPFRLSHSVEEFAELAGISRVTVYAEIRAGRLKARKIGRRTVVLDDEGRAYLKALPQYVQRCEPSKPGSRQPFAKSA